jgi:hypothetical protein
LNWLRKATNLLARARIDEQECVLRITIEPVAPRTLLQELRDGRVVVFSPDLVTNMKRAYLRGISATAEPISGDPWVDIEVTSPDEELPSLTLPTITVRLGRTSSSASLNVRDVGGGRPITNRSPLGNWIVRAVRDNGGRQISRLHLDFDLHSLRGSNHDRRRLGLGVR